MEKADFKKTLEELKQKMKMYKDHLETTVIENSPYIIQVGALTIGIDEARKVITCNSIFPTQFTRKAVDEILTMSFKDSNGLQVIPKVYSWFEWYSERLNELEETVIQLDTIISHND